LLILSLFFTLPLFSQASYKIKADSTINNKAIYLLYKKRNDSLYSGSGIMIKYKDEYFMVTAAHNTENMVFESLSIYFTADNSVKVLPVTYFVKDPENSLRTSKKYDLSTIRLAISKDSKAIIDNITLPAERIERKVNMVRKGTVVLGLGYIDYKGQSIADITPVEEIDSTTVDSGIIRFKRFDNYKLSHFFVLNKTVSKGMSGGPVFSGVDRDDWQSTYKVIGIFHGVFLNDDGKYYSLVTPLKGVFQLFSSFN
jgi:hypothetical protein